MALDRTETLRKAEKLLRQGRLEAAIGEYVRIVEEHPSDWNSANTLGDLYVRAAKSDKAAAQYVRVAEHFAREGFYPKAVALYKKILKVDPENESARLQLGDLSAKLGLVADAKAYLKTVADRRRSRGDQKGASEVMVRLGALDPAGAEAHLAAAETALRAGHLDQARGLLPEVLAVERRLRDQVSELAWTLVPQSPDAAYVCIEAVVNSSIAASEFADAATMLQEFVARVPGAIPALLKLVEVSVGGGLEGAMSDAQGQLTDAYLASGKPAEARAIAEDLVAREPWEVAHLDRFRRALSMLGVSDPDTVIAERLSGQMPFTATDVFTDTAERATPSAPGGKEPDPVSVPPPDKPPAPRASSPGPMEIALTGVLGDLDSERTSVGTPATHARENLEEVFEDLRRDAMKERGPDHSAQQMALARTYLEIGMADEAISVLKTAARSPRQRFEAGVILGRLFRERGDVPHAIEWLERAAEAPAPSADEGRALLYDLGVVLEDAGESARALAVFLELQTDAGEYRDVARRVTRLSRVQTGG